MVGGAGLLRRDQKWYWGGKRLRNAGLSYYKNFMLIQVHQPCHLTNPTNRVLLMAKKFQQCIRLWWQNRHSLVKFGNAKRLGLFCLMTQRHYWNYFAFSQSYLCYRHVLPEQRVFVCKISSKERSINRMKTTVTTRSVNQWKAVVNLLPGQWKLADCYPRTLTLSHPSEITVKYQ